MNVATILGSFFLLAVFANIISWVRKPTRFLYYPRQVAGRVIVRVYCLLGVVGSIVYFWQRRASFPTSFTLIDPIAVWGLIFCIWLCCYSLWRRHRSREATHNEKATNS